MNEAEKLINRLYGNIGFTCDSCGRETNGITYVNGMKFCAKCYQETFGNNNQQNEIQQLKQQIEEKDKEIAHLKEKDNYHLRYELAGADETIANLKKQLEEKDKDKTQLAIQELEKVKDTLKHFCNIHGDEYYGVKAEVKGIELDVCESIDYQIRELKGE